MKIKSIILSSLLIVFAFSLNAQWDIPDEAKNLKVPTEPTYDLVKEGRSLYYAEQGMKCSQCHGDATKGNSVIPNAADLGSDKFLSTNTPGEIFYKIKNGMGAMPPFAATYTDEKIWNIVFYIKSFDEKFKIKGEELQAYNGKIKLKANDETKKLFANIDITDNKGKEISKEGVELKFYVKRYFGNLPLGDAVVTDENGSAEFEFSQVIPGDEDGKIILKAGFRDTISYGTITDSIEMLWGEPLHFVNETLERTLWGPNNRVPLWLLLSYILITGGVWLGIFYVIFQLVKLKKAGNKGFEFKHKETVIN